MRSGTKTLRWTGVVLLLGFVAGFWPPAPARAGQITTRSLTLEAGAADGGSKPGGVVTHYFQFTLPSTTNVQSVQFKYCTTAADTGAQTCVMPTGLVTTAATLDDQTGATGFLIDTTDSTNGNIILTRSTANANGPVTYTLGHITNPTTANQTFYVRISTFTTADGTGSATDTGTVAASTTTPIVLTGIMPESLVFCTGAQVNLTGGVPDCSTATSGAVNFDRLFSPSDTAIATSQMAASTNAGQGYVISLFGSSMTSGSNTITPMSTAGIGVRNTSQFGTNLKANTTATSNPAVGIEIAPSSNATNYRGEALAGYNTVDNFKFNSGDNIADSGYTSLGGTDSQIYTNSYIVNVPGSQPAGTYTTTLTYICTPTF